MSEGMRQDEAHRFRFRWLWVRLVVLLALGAGAVAMVLVLPNLTSSDARLTSDWPTDRWVTSSPEEQSMDSGKLEAMLAYVDAHDMAVDSIVVVRHGRIVFEDYGPGHSPGQRHPLYSVTKSVTSMLIGIALDQGAIAGLDVPLAELLPEYVSAHPDPRRDKITLEHLLTMSDGIDWGEHDYPYEDARNIVSQMGNGPDAVQFILDRPMAREPGEAWAYNSGASILLGAILEEATGRNLVSFARQVLFDPVGIGKVYWEETSGGHYQTGGGLQMTPRDMARLGYLMLHHGEWDGRRILSADWVARSTTAGYQVAGLYGYGYQWWILPGGRGYRADGLYQQHLYVLPEADMVIAATADIRGDALHRIDGLVNTFILPACTDLPAPAARATYEAHGVTWEYPADFYVEEAPLPAHRQIGTRSGLVQITSNLEPGEMVSVFWNEVEEGEDVPMVFDAYLAALAAEIGLLTPGAPAEGQKDGHAMTLRFSELTLEGGTLPAVSGVWICDVTGRAFGATYLTTQEATQEALLAALEQYLEGLACH